MAFGSEGRCAATLRTPAAAVTTAFRPKGIRNPFYRELGYRPCAVYERFPDFRCLFAGRPRPLSTRLVVTVILLSESLHRDDGLT